METRPARDEAADYYFTYIDQVPPGEICTVLEAQLGETMTLLRAVPEDRSLHGYAPGKWTLRQVVSHVNDTERVFAFRALWFGRAFEEPLPKFDQDLAIAEAAADERPLASHVDEFLSVRSASLALFRSFPPSAWGRRGVASGHPVTVRALAYITAGHLAHHVRIVRDRYL